MTIVTELHGFERFWSPRALMAFLGLGPSEASSGAKQRRGAITKTGNSFVRRVLVEASHHCSKPPRVGVVVQRRRAGQPAEVVAIAERAPSGGRPGRVGVDEQGEQFPKCAS